ncbi:MULTISPECIES: crotonase/enoyl-CoA hydratase family protein [Gordonia]|uniref:Crotonase/enoyl-CoA hydratase family protein n=1 Tax=Gordonia amicalis TaxID=89053 RepID=A0ABU4DFJ3_9ACTN|nr:MULTISPECIES: crotonase/enoyl-CoA hydratase family protein [Gordonia]ATD72305.1 enoyl-CoA hydratase [Gordonia sp. 1D]MCR8896005.1 crotonase/enoyl-CoA hydratase family protein [Gordonia sp. GONU]MCZ4651562.1 crotonase/enoyl-CoA hydratase family protein [Gordonia amicalis]MDJ0452595.1 crotonase/enoyl-CoA hydratase family protein [Gordonia amicalis]MDV6307831.1 crotonase/enoyl-CoA hydratase family protein [Gordonia amicalis]
MTAELEVAGPAEVLTDIRGGVLVITINRPEQRNAMSKSAAEAIAAALTRLDADPDLAVGILTGGTETFCAGMDLKRFQQLGERPVVDGRGFGGLVESPPAKPLIAAVEGWALGGGFEMVLAADLVVAGEGAKFGLPEVKRGLIARAGGAIRIPRVLPRAVALELLLTGEPMAAATAKHFGLVNRVTADGAALQAALELASVVAGNAPLAVRASKALADRSRLWPDGEAFTRQVEFTDPVFASQDAKEGPAAFAERRTPRWTGR